MNNLIKREWVFLEKPKSYAIAGCFCGNEDTQWSEFQNHLWCDKCQKDFIPEHNGILDGPILMETSQLMGINFSRLILNKNKVEVLDKEFNYIECQNIEEIINKKYLFVNIKDENKKIFSKTKLFYENLTLEETKLKDGNHSIQLAVINLQQKIINIFLNLKTINNITNIIKNEDLNKLNNVILNAELKNTNKNNSKIKI